MSNGFFNVEADTRKNIHPLSLSVDCEKWTFKEIHNLNILPRYDFGVDHIFDISIYDTRATESAIDDLLENIPSIKIREYTQDLKVTQCLNLIEYGIQGFKDAGEVVKGMESSAAFTRTIIDEFTKSEVYAKMFGVGTIGGNLPYPKGTDGEMLTLAYNLYYHIMGHTTTNKYELPFISKFLYETNGMDGWPSGPESGFGGTTNYSIVGKLLNLIGSNYKIVTEPIWKPVANSNGTNIELTVHLFNDTIYSAVWNYLFVNTITSHNMPLQYGIIQQPPSVYEINIQGGKRLFMCSGKFSVKNIGVVRKVTKKVLEEIKKQVYHSESINDNTVRIPDVYEVTLTFKSLLPDVFNDFLLQFAMSDQDIFDHASKESGVFEKYAGNIKDEVERILDKAKAAAKVAEAREKAEEERKRAEEMEKMAMKGWNAAQANK